MIRSRTRNHCIGFRPSALIIMMIPRQSTLLASVSSGRKRRRSNGTRAPWPVTQILADGHFRPGKVGCNQVELSLPQAYSASPNASLATLDGSFCRLLQGHSPRPHAPAPSYRSSTRTICVRLFAGRPRSRLMSLLAKSAGPSGARPLQHSEAPLHAEAGLEAGECVDRLVGLPHPRMKEVWEIPRMRRRGGGE